MKNIQNLHSHTKLSDGELSHFEILDVCRKVGISVVAFTDHDTVMSPASFKMLKNYKSDVKWISGIEISSGWPKELGVKATSAFHIVGLFVDPTNKDLQYYCKKAKAGRTERMQRMTKNLKSLGFTITDEDCLKASQGETPSRPNIVTALYYYDQNIRLIEELREKMKKEAMSNEDTRRKYNAMMEQGEHEYPYVLFLSEDSFIPGIYFDYLFFLDMDSTVKLIRNAGGVAILAHYFTVSNKIAPELLDKILLENRLDGVETVYGLMAYGTGTEIEKVIKETSKTADELTTKNNKLKSGGADAHKKQDFIDFANSGEYAEKTIGMAENIIKNSNVNPEYSNY
jgi:predicted metal-dependent phosphoesterase TrpH